ncbi:carboxylesterase 5A [Lingula anatina]|uniref:Carboxylic ester hydrolase n=1 Tax=Lingula anatina TaxID=7574 RepID=A0A1S3IGH5_LINAN|nr:carboxylesterase 5A [Lingula anatina]|eukprot:XP_013397365.1 carboxylesterase 5A [Lingula anatina]
MEAWKLEHVIEALMLFTSMLFVSGVNSQTLVTITNGKLEGIKESVQGKTLNRFMGIPFAKPPLGALRFMKPQPAGNWTGVKNATKHGPSCMQTWVPDFYQSEDCLTLNVLVPGVFNASLSKAVMVWIYGGGYNMGGSVYYIFDDLAVEDDVIVVTVNYRVGPFGFLSTGDVNAPGNAGLWDQIEGLKWVRDNIASFGGDPNRITIFGESAGASSVSQLAMTTATKGLFHRVISQSGAALSPWAWVHDAIDVAMTIGNLLGCNATTTDTAKLVRCLQNQDSVALINASSQITAGRTYFGFSPVVDGDFFPRSVTELLKDTDSDVLRHFRSVDYLIGFTDSDGGVFLFKLPFNYTSGIPGDKLRDTLIPQLALQISALHKDEIEAKMKDIYYDPSADKEATARHYVDLLTDLEFAGPTLTLLTSHLTSTNKSSYLYLFTKIPSWQSALSWFRGSNHAADIGFIIGPNVSHTTWNVTFNEGERRFSRSMQTYWSNFAKTGNPNLPKAVPTEWKQYTDSQKHYLELGDDITSKMDVIPKRMKLWLESIPQILSRDKNVIPSPTNISKGNNCWMSSLVLFLAGCFYFSII